MPSHQMVVSKTKYLAMEQMPKESQKRKGKKVFLKGSRAYLFGIVSRGRGCGYFNQPGIYTRLMAWLPWIQHHMAEDKCSYV